MNYYTDKIMNLVIVMTIPRTRGLSLNKIILLLLFLLLFLLPLQSDWSYQLTAGIISTCLHKRTNKKIEIVAMKVDGVITIRYITHTDKRVIWLLVGSIPRTRGQSLYKSTLLPLLLSLSFFHFICKDLALWPSLDHPKQKILAKRQKQRKYSQHHQQRTP